MLWGSGTGAVPDRRPVDAVGDGACAAVPPRDSRHVTHVVPVN